MRAHLAGLGAILAAAVLVYSNTFDVPFTFDDDPHLVEPATRPNVSAALAACSGQNRCVAFATFAANYAAGGLEVGGYHAVNLAIHAGAGVLVYLLALLLARTPRLRGTGLAERPRQVAFGAAVLFVVHPLQTMAVTYVVQRFASLLALFYLASLAAWVAARLDRGPATRRVVLYGLSLAAALLAMKTKENAVTLPLALALVELAFFEGPRLPRLARLFPWALPVVLPAMVTLGAAPLAGGVDAVLRSDTSMSRLGYASTELTVVPAYLRLLALPIGQSIDHHPSTYEDPWHAAPLAGGALLAALLIGAVSLVWRPPRGERALVLVGFGFLWFFLTLSLESSVLPIKDVMVEHRLYLPSVGVFLAVAAGWALGLQRLGRSRPLAARAGGFVTVALLAGLGAAAYARNAVWRDEPELWRRAIALAPEAWRPYGNTGQALLERGRCAEALPYFEAARARDGSQLVPLLDQALCHATLGDLALAEREFRQAMELAPRDARAPAQLGRLAAQAGDLPGARARYERALELSPASAEAHAGLGATLGQLGLLAQARVHLEQAAAADPSQAMVWNNLGNVRLLSEDPLGAEDAYRRALSCDRADAASRENLARLLEQRGAGEAAQRLRSGGPP